MDCSQSSCSGDHDEQGKEPDELFIAHAKGLGSDYVHDYKLDPVNGEEYQHGVRGLEASDKNSQNSFS